MKQKRIIIFVFLLWLVICLGYGILRYFGFIKVKSFIAEDFDISIVQSDIDYNANGVDDYTDILRGAKSVMKMMPTYKSVYYDGGYPPENEGVCTDVIWRSLKQAGYNLKELVDQDIENNLGEYPNISKPDPNIDFRRVTNLNIYLSRHALSLTIDLSKIEQWQPGDIVIVNNNKHIGIVSDKRNRKGIPYLIHHTGSLSNKKNHLEEDILEYYAKVHGIVAHYRFHLS